MKTVQDNIHAALKFRRKGGERGFGMAIKELSDALKLDPRDAEANFYMGKFLYEKGSIYTALEATEAFEAATRLNEEYLSPYYFAGLTYYHLGALDKAIQHFRKVVEIDPNYLIAYYHLGRALTKKKLWDEAIHAFESIVGVNSDDSDVFFNLGYCYLKVGGEDRATWAFNRALELNPDDENTKEMLKHLIR
jgi:tetratricopeptide (TPR) repeat protein